MARADPTETICLSGCALPGLHVMQAESARSFARHSHDLYGIGVVDRGAHRSWSGQGAVQALPGDVITVNPGEVHDGIAPTGQARAWRMVYVEPALLQDEGGMPEITHAALHDERLRASFDRLYTDAVHGADALTLEEGIARLQHCAPLARPARKRPARGARPELERVRARLADDTASPSLAGLAREAGMSRYQLLRAFTAAYGLPPHAWRLQQRLARARALIALGTPLAQAAACAGFADQSHMTRTFARFWGFTPGAYAALRRP